MRMVKFLGLICLVLVGAFGASSQTKSFNRYEVEILLNPTVGKKDTREVNAVIIFETDKVVVKSRRSAEIFKEISYSDIKFAEHSYSIRPWLSQAAVSVIATAVAGIPFYAGNNEKHWMSVIGSSDFFVLKLENDNFRQIKAEFLIRKVEVDDVGNAGKSKKRPKSEDEKPKVTEPTVETTKSPAPEQ